MATRVPDDPTASTIDAGGIGDRPSSDAVAMERARARSELALFGRAEPAQIGRYEVLEPIASGGMGVVFAAYDPQLDRRVALKVVHPQRSTGDQAHRRLIIEARALAKLDHPNVVKVHDTLAVDDQVVIVMELVDGRTLEAWTREQPRTWREILDAYLQAGDGLAAAHAVDVVHRDFKPSNAIIGADRRVRVLDFGLARFLTDLEDTHPDAGAPAGRPSLEVKTLPGTVMGTFAYASPEQLTGGRVTPASDQFSFCVSLHRALEGVAPFAGTTIGELVICIQAGAVQVGSSDTHLPPWLRAAIRRGFHADPTVRFPSMTALLRELRRPRGWRRWRTPIAGVALAATVGIGIAGWAGHSNAPPRCDDGRGLIAPVWGTAQRAALESKLGDSAYAREASRTIGAALDRRSADWRAGRVEACESHRRGTRSDRALDHAVACLDRRLDDVRIALQIVDEATTIDPARATELVATLPSITACLAPEVTERAAQAPPPAVRDAVAAAQALIHRAGALRVAGQRTEARQAASDAAAAARATGFAPAIAEAQLALGRILIELGYLKDADAQLGEAITLGLGAGDDDVAVEAAARRIYARMLRGEPAAVALEGVEFADGLGRRLTTDRTARPLLENNIAAVYMAAGDDATARARLVHARSELDAVAQPDLELVCIDQNLAMLTSDPIERERLVTSAWQRLRGELGDDHPTTLDALRLRGELETDAVRGITVIEQVYAAHRTFHPELTADRNSLAYELTFLGWLAGRTVADDTMQDARALASPKRHAILEAQIALSQRRPAEAIQLVAPLLAAPASTAPRWDRAIAAHAELITGLALRDEGQLNAAAGHLQVAAASYAELARHQFDLVTRLAETKAHETLDSMKR